MHSYIALAAMYILKTGFDLSVMMKNAPLSGFINPADNKPFPALFFSNEGGGRNERYIHILTRKNTFR